MVEIINLNKARKARARSNAKSQAAANRVSHGMTKGDRGKAGAETARLNQILNGARRDRSDDEPA